MQALEHRSGCRLPRSFLSQALGAVLGAISASLTATQQVQTVLTQAFTSDSCVSDLMHSPAMAWFCMLRVSAQATFPQMSPEGFFRLPSSIIIHLSLLTVQPRSSCLP